MLFLALFLSMWLLLMLLTKWTTVLFDKWTDWRREREKALYSLVIRIPIAVVRMPWLFSHACQSCFFACVHYLSVCVLSNRWRWNGFVLDLNKKNPQVLLWIQHYFGIYFCWLISMKIGSIQAIYGVFRQFFFVVCVEFFLLIPFPCSKLTSSAYSVVTFVL